MFEIVLKQDYEDIFFFREFEINGVSSSPGRISPGNVTPNRLSPHRNSPRGNSTMGTPAKGSVITVRN